MAVAATGARRYHVYRPPGVRFGERLPLMVMLHGCMQDSKSFATSTRMNAVAARERFLVLYPEQDRLANPQGCWNWFDTRSGRAQAEATLVLNAIDQVCMLYGADRERIALAGLSAGASLAALIAARHPERFRAVVMHSGIPPGTAHSGLTALRAMHGRRATAPLAAVPPSSGTQPLPPLLVIHGLADHVVAPANGRAAASAWAAAAGAREGSMRSVCRGKRYPMRITDFKHRAAMVAQLIEIEGLGHAWSGGAKGQRFGDSGGPGASRLAWAFALKQFKAFKARGALGSLAA